MVTSALFSISEKLAATYDVNIYAESESEDPLVYINIISVYLIDWNGDYRARFNVNNVPSGVYLIKQDRVEVAKIYVGVKPHVTYQLNLRSSGNLILIPVTPVDRGIGYIFSAEWQANIYVIWDYNGCNWLCWTTKPGYSNQFSLMVPKNAMVSIAIR